MEDAPMAIRVIILILICVQFSFSRTFASWGVASEHPGTKQYSDVKFVEFGASGEHGKLAYTCGVGGWHDTTGYKHKEGRTKYTAASSYFLETLFGVEPKSEHFYIGYKLGPVIISHTDALLGSNLQIGHELGIGMRDIKEVRVGLVLKHFSNAGIIKPNLGRDFVGLRMEF